MARFDFGEGLKSYERFVSKRWRGHPNPGLSRKLKKLGPEYRKLRDLFIMSTGNPGEAGEVSELLKKYVRDGKIDKRKLKLELGDQLFYLTRIAIRFGIGLEDIIDANVEKLTDRAKRKVLHGSGDDR